MQIYIIGSVSQEAEIIKAVKFLDTHLHGLEFRYVQKENRPLSDLIDKAFDTIKNWADIVVVVPKIEIDGSIKIGDGTLYEMEYAKRCGVPVMIYSLPR